MITKSNTSYKISEFAMQSILYEVACLNKPGLVSPISNGAHDDMNYFTFIDSTCSIVKTLNHCSILAFSNKNAKQIFHSVRKAGALGEKEMLSKTNGVNTHKGMLFLMGISCAAVSKCIHDNKGFECIQPTIKEMTEGISEKELEKKINYLESTASHGEKMYLLYGCKGIRGEVEAGLPIVFNNSLIFYENNKELEQNERLLQTLLYIMEYNDDTNILYRHSPEVLNKVKKTSRDVLSAGGLYTKQGKILLNKMNNDFIKAKISPGGSADLLAITVFFSLIKEYMTTF